MLVYVLKKTKILEDFDSYESIEGVYTESKKIELTQSWSEKVKKIAEDTKEFYTQEIKKLELDSNSTHIEAIILFNSLRIKQFKERLNELNKLVSDKDYMNYYRISEGYCWEQYCLVE